MRVLHRLLLIAALCLSPLAAAADPARILVFGDSLARGYGLPPGRGFVPALSRWLEAEGAEVRLLNAGLSGDTTFGGRVRIHWALRRGADAVIVEIGGNDMLLGLAPELAESNLDAILSAAGAGGRPVLLLGVTPWRGDPGWRARWRAMWPRLAARHHALLVPDLYEGIRAVPEERRGAMLQRDGIHASERGVASMVRLVGPKVLQLLSRLPAERQCVGECAGAGALP